MMDVHKRLIDAEASLATSARSGNNSQEMRELRAAVHSLLKAVKYLVKKGKH